MGAYNNVYPKTSEDGFVISAVLEWAYIQVVMFPTFILVTFAGPYFYLRRNKDQYKMLEPLPTARSSVSVGQYHHSPRNAGVGIHLVMFPTFILATFTGPFFYLIRTNIRWSLCQLPGAQCQQVSFTTHHPPITAHMYPSLLLNVHWSCNHICGGKYFL